MISLLNEWKMLPPKERPLTDYENIIEKNAIKYKSPEYVKRTSRRLMDDDRQKPFSLKTYLSKEDYIGGKKYSTDIEPENWKEKIAAAGIVAKNILQTGGELMATTGRSMRKGISNTR